MSDIVLYAIDNDKDLLRAIKLFLCKRDFKVFTFSKWHTAFERMKKHKPQIILLDLFLGKNGIDGLDVCQKLKASPFTKDVPVILFSGFKKVSKSAVEDYGAYEFIEKPLEFNRLIKVIRKALGSSSTNSE